MEISQKRSWWVRRKREERHLFYHLVLGPSKAQPRLLRQAYVYGASQGLIARYGLHATIGMVLKIEKTAGGPQLLTVRTTQAGGGGEERDLELSSKVLVEKKKGAALTYGGSELFARAI